MREGAEEPIQRRADPRDAGVSQETFYRWRRRFGEKEVPAARRLKHLEDENRKLKRLVADLTLDNQSLRDALGQRP